ncbi:MAG: phosphoserine aminotransferase [Pseudomonadota bacterium]|jgi:phosphoserine aminotransferase
MLPIPVVEQIKADLPNWNGQNAAVFEVSHRGKAFEALIQEAEQNLRSLLAVPDNYKVIFMQGGAWGQFAAVPMNLLPPGQTADYVVTGGWSRSAAKEAGKFGQIKVIASSEATGFQHIPEVAEWQHSKQAAYTYVCSNETVYGTEMHFLHGQDDLLADKTLVADASSHFLSRPMPVSRYGLIYAGAQKNVGPAGVTMVIVREDLLERTPKNIASVFDYRNMAASGSLFNTPPTFAIYATALTLKWIIAEGGLAEMERRALTRSGKLYDVIDQSSLFHAPVAKADRSRMNVVFSTGDAERDTRFVAFCAQRGLMAVKGHKMLGGMRASVYNAMPMAGVDALVAAIKDFERAQ